ncbi:hypothetical protein R3P38DRAFT_2780728 [Favolaschia claudopus]|uniref:Uncharacterized protein n=1 Tax=Favolaschia claudopus TaxID=2862362 RepID=A0AAW0B6F7_9AGAR
MFGPSKFPNREIVSLQWLIANPLMTKYMSFVPQSGSGSRWSQHGAVLSLGRVIQAAAVLPDLIINDAKTSILDRSRWEIARSYLLLYSWYKETAPQLAKTLVGLHREGYWSEAGGYCRKFLFPVTGDGRPRSFVIGELQVVSLTAASSKGLGNDRGISYPTA